jgi:hypothetical protein
MGARNNPPTVLSRPPPHEQSVGVSNDGVLLDDEKFELAAHANPESKGFDRDGLAAL